MAEADKDQERNEQATPRRREEARKEGQTARSLEVPSVTVLLFCLIYFYFDAAGMLGRIMVMMRRTLREAGTTVLDGGTVQSVLAGLIYESFLIILPLLFAVVAAGLLANYVQVGFLFSAETIKPKLSKIDPIKGFRRLFSLRAVAELVKNILKIIVIGTVVFFTVRGEMEGAFLLSEQNAGGMLAYVGEMTFKIISRTCWVLVFLAFLDYLYQRWEYEKGLRMTKQEIKDEHKQTEGEPMVRARIRRLQREMARKRMMAKVPKADVVITNPDHIAVALRYDSAQMHAPVLLAKGSGFAAERIRKVARENGVPIVENKPLARMIFQTVDLDQAIPEKFYRAVAEVLAYVYGLRRAERAV